MGCHPAAHFIWLAVVWLRGRASGWRARARSEGRGIAVRRDRAIPPPGTAPQSQGMEPPRKPGRL